MTMLPPGFRMRSPFPLPLPELHERHPPPFPGQHHAQSRWLGNKINKSLCHRWRYDMMVVFFQMKWKFFIRSLSRCTDCNKLGATPESQPGGEFCFLVFLKIFPHISLSLVLPDKSFYDGQHLYKFGRYGESKAVLYGEKSFPLV